MDAAVEQFQGGVSIFQQQLDALIASVDAERTSLTESAEQLKVERQQYEEEKQRVSQVCTTFSDVFQLTARLTAAAVDELQLNSGLLRQRESDSECWGYQFHDYPNHTAECTCSISLCSNV